MGLLDKGMDKAIEKLTPIFEARFGELRSTLQEILKELQAINAKMPSD